MQVVRIRRQAQQLAQLLIIELPAILRLNLLLHELVPVHGRIRARPDHQLVPVAPQVVLAWLLRNQHALELQFLRNLLLPLEDQQRHLERIEANQQHERDHSLHKRQAFEYVNDVVMLRVHHDYLQQFLSLFLQALLNALQHRRVLAQVWRAIVDNLRLIEDHEDVDEEGQD